MRVLRMKPGDEAFVFDGNGRELRCLFSSLESDRAVLEIIDELSNPVESPIRITLAQALVKGDKFELIVQKATELGVTGIVPLITQNADVRPIEERTGRRVDRWRRVSLEALKQCGRRTLVDVATPRPLRDFLRETNAAAGRVVLSFTESGGGPIAEVLRGASPSEVVAVIGPEGGWSNDEVDLFIEASANLVSLGPRVLRTETAAIAAIALIQNHAGDVSR